MGLFGWGDKKEKEKKEKEEREHAETRRRMEETVRKRRQETGAPAGIAPASTAPAGAPAATTAGTAGGSEYTVQSGDSLSKIAQQKLGDAGKWRQIYDANRATIGDNPDLIKPGQRLRIPG